MTSYDDSFGPLLKQQRIERNLPNTNTSDINYDFTLAFNLRIAREILKKALSCKTQSTTPNNFNSKDNDDDINRQQLIACR